jgi:transcriptional regulator with XRE-family HTH domain
MTESLVLRWATHSKVKELQKIDGVRIAWLKWKDTESLDQAESFFIRALRPLLNVRGIEQIEPVKEPTNDANSLFTDSQNEFLSSTYSRLHRRTKIDPSIWSKWFNGETSPTLDTLRKAAEGLEMSLIELIEAFEERRAQTMRDRGSRSRRSRCAYPPKASRTIAAKKSA